MQVFKWAFAPNLQKNPDGLYAHSENEERCKHCHALSSAYGRVVGSLAAQ
jgi:hypothetical protein